eukprot:maker-scaffold187_size272365-snap-gene-0.14 protein:Tk10315 transcript:maker-scaffold187_size272365-snap-gene-0.14-mRNA-1 annotation:"hypothetical protein DAPPUDRAFT_227138"
MRIRSVILQHIQMKVPHALIALLFVSLQSGQAKSLPTPDSEADIEARQGESHDTAYNSIISKYYTTDPFFIEQYDVQMGEEEPRTMVHMDFAKIRPTPEDRHRLERKPASNPYAAQKQTRIPAPLLVGGGVLGVELLEPVVREKKEIPTSKVRMHLTKRPQPKVRMVKKVMRPVAHRARKQEEQPVRSRDQYSPEEPEVEVVEPTREILSHSRKVHLKPKSRKIGDIVSVEDFSKNFGPHNKVFPGDEREDIPSLPFIEGNQNSEEPQKMVFTGSPGAPPSQSYFDLMGDFFEEPEINIFPHDSPPPQEMREPEPPRFAPHPAHMDLGGRFDFQKSNQAPEEFGMEIEPSFKRETPKASGYSHEQFDEGRMVSPSFESIRDRFPPQMDHSNHIEESPPPYTPSKYHPYAEPLDHPNPLDVDHIPEDVEIYEQPIPYQVEAKPKPSKDNAPTMGHAPPKYRAIAPHNFGYEVVEFTPDNVELEVLKLNAVPDDNNAERPSFSTFTIPQQSYSQYDLPKPSYSQYEKPDPSYSQYDKPEPSYGIQYDKAESSFSQYDKPESSFSQYDKPESSFSQHDEPESSYPHFEKGEESHSQYSHPHRPTHFEPEEPNYSHFPKPEVIQPDYETTKPKRHHNSLKAPDFFKYAHDFPEADSEIRGPPSEGESAHFSGAEEFANSIPPFRDYGLLPFDHLDIEGPIVPKEHRSLPMDDSHPSLKYQPVEEESVSYEPYDFGPALSQFHGIEANQEYIPDEPTGLKDPYEVRQLPPRAFVEEEFVMPKLPPPPEMEEAMRESNFGSSFPTLGARISYQPSQALFDSFSSEMASDDPFRNNQVKKEISPGEQRGFSRSRHNFFNTFDMDSEERDSFPTDRDVEIREEDESEYREDEDSLATNPNLPPNLTVLEPVEKIERQRNQEAKPELESTLKYLFPPQGASPPVLESTFQPNPFKGYEEESFQENAPNYEESEYAPNPYKSSVMEGRELSDEELPSAPRYEEGEAFELPAPEDFFKGLDRPGPFGRGFESFKPSSPPAPSALSNQKPKTYLPQKARPTKKPAFYGPPKKTPSPKTSPSTKAPVYRPKSSMQYEHEPHVSNNRRINSPMNVDVPDFHEFAAGFQRRSGFGPPEDMLAVEKTGRPSAIQIVDPPRHARSISDAFLPAPQRVERRDRSQHGRALFGLNSDLAGVDKSQHEPHQFINVAANGEYKAGFNRGHPEHHVQDVQEHLGHNHREEVNWSDAHSGYGKHYYEFNHGDKYKMSVSHH